MCGSTESCQEFLISTTTSHNASLRVPALANGRVYKQINHQVVGTKRARRRMVRFSLLIINLVLLGAVAIFVVNASRPGLQNSNAALGYAVKGDELAVGPLDQLSSVDIAVNVARVTDLPEEPAVNGQSISAKVLTAIAPADTAVVAKPQVVTTNRKSVRDIQVYTSVLGDTVASVAAKFGVTSNSIRWSNDLTAENIPSGRNLLIPPVDGIVYTVKSGDTADSLAEKYRANKAQLIEFNDAEVSGLQENQRIVIPDGQKPAPVAPRSSYSGYAFTARYGYNGYDPGWCTWYVANKVSVPTNWGNANTWDDRARATPGWVVSKTPQIGAVAQSNAGWAGHVGVVEDVKIEEGVYYIKYSDMNGLAGFNRVGYSDWVVAIGKYQNFIYRQ